MKEVIIIGTLHGGFTPKEELKELLSSINPDKVLVELSPEELARPVVKSTRDDMFTAYDWATGNNKQVAVFDIENDTLKEGVTGEEPEFAEFGSAIEGLLKEYSWKELNREEPWKSSDVLGLENKLMEKYFNIEKNQERDFTMFQNIKDNLIEGKNVVLTGTGHLTFFKEQMPEAKLFFRD